MAERTNRVAWRLAVVLAVVMVVGVGVLLYQRASFNLRQNALVDAAKRGNTAEVAQLLDAGAKANAPGSGDWPLTTAVGARRIAVVKLLLERGASASAPIAGLGGITPLWVAASTDSPEMVKLLIAHGDKANLPLPGGETILNAAASFFGSAPQKDRRHAEIVRILISNGADPKAQGSQTGDIPLMSAALGDHPATALALLDGGANPNQSDRHSGWTPLMWAAHHGDAALVGDLVAHGADVNAKSKSGLTALMEAAFQGNPSVVKRLLAHGANVNAREHEKGYSALTLAQTNGHADLVPLLRPAGGSRRPHTPAGLPATH